MALRFFDRQVVSSLSASGPAAPSLSSWSCTPTSPIRVCCIFPRNHQASIVKPLHGEHATPTKSLFDTRLSALLKEQAEASQSAGLGAVRVPMLCTVQSQGGYSDRYSWGQSPLACCAATFSRSQCCGQAASWQGRAAVHLHLTQVVLDLVNRRAFWPNNAHGLLVVLSLVPAVLSVPGLLTVPGLLF